MECGKCGSMATVKAGRPHGKQRYKCKECGRQFIPTKDKNAQKRAAALYYYVLGLSLNAIAKMYKVAPSTVLYWVRNFSLKIYENPPYSGSVEVNLNEELSHLTKKDLKPENTRYLFAVPASH